MMPNSTLLIQMVHFLIAYWLIARFLFRPVIAEIDRADMILQAQQKRIADEKLHVEELRMQLAKQWQEYQGRLKNAIPKPCEYQALIQEIPHHELMLSQEEYSQLRAYLTSALTERALK